MVRKCRLFLLPLGLCLTSGALAAVLRVDGAAPGPTHDGATWATAFLAITPSIASAVSGDEVWVAKGTYVEHLTMPGGVGLYGGFAGTETSRDQRDWKANVTVLQPAAGATSVVNCGFHSIVVDGFTISAGSFTGVNVTAGSAVIARCDISGTLVGDRAAVWATGGRTVVAGNRVRGFFAGVRARTAMVTATNNDIRECLYGVYTNSSIMHLAGNALIGNREGAYLSSGTAVLANNTVAANTTGVTLDVFNLAVLEGNVIANNKGSGFFIYPASPSTAIMVSHGNVFGNVVDYAGYTPVAGQGNISQDPLFVDAANGDYRLSAGSPCINAGDDEMVQTGAMDLDGKSRILGAHVDIGAYEYGTPGALPFTVEDVTRCLSIVEGSSAGSQADLYRLNAEGSGPALELADALRLARKVAGLEPNP